MRHTTRWRRTIVAPVLGTLIASAAWAGEQPAPLPLEAVLAEARTRNPEIQAARERAGALASLPAQAAAWDDPTLSWEAWNAPDSFRLDHADNNIFRVSQKIPFPGKRRLAGDVAAYDAQRATHDIGRAELMVLSGVKTAYYALWEAYARTAVLERDRDLVARLTRAVEGKYAAGEATQSDALRLQVELTHVATQLETERLAIDEARSRLAALLSRATSEVAGVPIAPPAPVLGASLEELVARALEHRPETLGEDQAIARDAAAVELAKRNRLPDFEVSLGRFVNDDARDGFGAMASVTLPIFNRGKYDAAIQEANARLAATRSDKRLLADRIRREVEQAYLAARTALLQHQLFVGTHVPQAEQSLRVTEGAYETNAAGFTELIDTLRAVQSVHLEHLAAQGRFEAAYAALEQAVGTELPRATPALSRSRTTHEAHHE